MKISKGRGAVSDGMDTNATIAPTRQLSHDTKTLIIYFSRGGNTESQAQFAQQTLGADLYELVVRHPYPANYRASVDRATDERESKEWPELSIADLPDLTQYDSILLGHPIWAMTVANPMRSFLEAFGNQFDGKTVASFSTNAGYGSGNTQMVLQALLPKSAKILSNYSVQDINVENTRDQFKNWLLRLPMD